MTNDLSITCDSELYKFGFIWACVMVVIYPLGLPLIGLCLLYHIKHEIKTRDDEVEGGEEDEENGDNVSNTNQPSKVSANKKSKSMIKKIDEDNNNNINNNDNNSNTPTKANTNKQGEIRTPNSTITTPITTPYDNIDDELNTDNDNNYDYDPNVIGKTTTVLVALEFLYSSYRPHLWYWEIIETLRRLVMTAVLSIIQPGTSMQACLAIVLALASIKIQTSFDPYSEFVDSALA